MSEELTPTKEELEKLKEEIDSAISSAWNAVLDHKSKMKYYKKECRKHKKSLLGLIKSEIDDLYEEIFKIASGIKTSKKNMILKYKNLREERLKDIAYIRQQIVEKRASLRNIRKP